MRLWTSIDILLHGDKTLNEYLECVFYSLYQHFAYGLI